MGQKGAVHEGCVDPLSSVDPCAVVCVAATVRNFTVFAPTDKAIQQAFRSGSLNYPYLFARNKTLLDGIVAYHVVPQFQFAGPSKQTLNMKTLLSEVRWSVTRPDRSAASCQGGRQ